MRRRGQPAQPFQPQPAGRQDAEGRELGRVGQPADLLLAGGAPGERQLAQLGDGRGVGRLAPPGPADGRGLDRRYRPALVRARPHRLEAGERHLGHDPAPEPLPLRPFDGRELREPLLAVPLEQLLLAHPQEHLRRIPLRQPGALHLHADELGALVAAVLLQPVGVHQARRVLVDVRDDVVQEALGHAHCVPSQTGASRAVISVTTSARARGTCGAPRGLT